MVDEVGQKEWTQAVGQDIRNFGLGHCETVCRLAGKDCREKIQENIGNVQKYRKL